MKKFENNGLRSGETMVYAVQMKQITKQFPKVLANDHVDFDVYQGEIHALVGENGAGKSTLMNILYGLYLPTAGEIVIKGESVRLGSALDAIRHGIGMVHQHFMLIPRLSVTENIVLGAESQTRKRGIFFDRQAAIQKVEAVSREYSLQIDAAAKVKNISLGMQQRVEILKTVYRGADIIILDEPTAVLTPQEIEELGEILKALKKMGKTVIIITHKIDEVMSFSDRVTVLRQGRKVGTIVTAEVDEKQITRMMVGKDIALGGHKETTAFVEDILTVRGVNLTGKQGKRILADINLSLKRGEIVGVSGIDGSGQTQLAEVISGVCRPDSGTVVYKGQDITRESISVRKDQGIAFIPQDRHKDGLVLPFSIQDNLVLGFQRRKEFCRGRSRINQEALKVYAAEKIKEYDIRTPSPLQPAETLSGGNQQKIIAARELSNGPELIVADQPTRGIDVGAIEFIHNILTERRNEGCGVLLVSLELDELMLLSDRIVVMNQGRIAGIVRPEETTREEIGLLMVGGTNVKDEGEGRDDEGKR